MWCSIATFNDKQQPEGDNIERLGERGFFSSRSTEEDASTVRYLKLEITIK